MEIVLIEPQIPPNTGNVARLCAAVRLPLHLVGQLGFQINDRQLRRAGLDYWPHAQVHQHQNSESFLQAIPRSRLLFFSTRGSQTYLNAPFREDTCLAFGSETTGFPSWIFETYPDRIFRIPILNPAVRSLNLANAVAIVTFEALRQLGTLGE
jgi:tRNA (cytidine/uridine-2'-O-)-methyltransferase